MSTVNLFLTPGVSGAPCMMLLLAVAMIFNPVLIMRFATLFAVALTFASASTAIAQTPPSACGGIKNRIPTCTDAPRFISSVKNGKKYMAGCGNDTFYVLHAWGTPYEMGFAQGQMMAEHIPTLEADFTSYLVNILSSKLGKILPQWLIDLIAEYGAPMLLDETYDATMPFTPNRYLEEMQGFADGGNTTYKFVRRLNMFPELTKAACTIVGANGPSTPTGTIQHLRGLDFDPDVPFKDFSTVVVYHGDGSEPKVANFAWAGMLGSLTGISDRSIGIGEKVWLDHPRNDMGVHGQPWMFILRDVLYALNMSHALSTMKNANRTCAIHVGVGDSTTNTFRGVKMAKDNFDVVNDTSINYPAHPILKGIVYWNKHEQPSNNFCLSDLLRQHYGNITAKVLAKDVAAISRTGDCQAVAFDYQALTAYVSNARKTYVTSGDLNAYYRQFTLLDVGKLFKEASP